jgi:2-C-methyl-D-erythritol 4-phosphate cytidylyltransferase/2-C-methyl-D-erythritol 2,4-cyclodiphosphate synthase
LSISLIVLAAGNSTRFGQKVKKQWIRVGNKPLWYFVANRFKKIYQFDKIIITASKDEVNYMQYFDKNFIVVEGGNTRQESMKNALQFVTSPYVMVTDVARVCVPKKIIKNLIKHKTKASCIVPILDVSDTVIYNNDTINRENTKLIQTPQLSKTDILKKAILKGDFTDDSSAIKNINESIYYIKGSIKSHKITFKKDLKKLPCLKKAKKRLFIGYGRDLHPFDYTKKSIFLGGIEVECGYGFVAHSDGDVVIHSIIDAILGAIGAGDIGEFFPDNDDKYKNISSLILLQDIIKFITKIGYKLQQIDITIISEQPKINPIKNKIRFNLSQILQIKPININIKATTNEKLGIIGEKKAMIVESIAVLKVRQI